MGYMKRWKMKKHLNWEKYSEREVEGEVGGPHTSLIPVQFRLHKRALKLYMD
jgi:hypothetical protein